MLRSDSSRSDSGHPWCVLPMKRFRAASIARSHQRRPRPPARRLTRVQLLAMASPVIASLLTPDEWARLMRCCKHLRTAVGKARPSVRELVVAEPRSLLREHWLAHGWPSPASLGAGLCCHSGASHGCTVARTGPARGADIVMHVELPVAAVRVVGSRASGCACNTYERAPGVDFAPLRGIDGFTVSVRHLR